ncbi:MAG: AhpC/TSA family protein [Actinomycetota bacterium]
MRDRLDDLGPDTTVVLVTFTDPANLSDHIIRTMLPFPVLTDPDRRAYRAYGFGRGSITRVWGWRAARRYVQLLADGGWRDLARPTEDTLQLGGDMVIGPDGTLAWGFWGAGPDDRPAVDEIIAAVEATR